jgi:cation diffusion facilitator CzcD-associated flavoprotein CzcO
VDTVILGAGPYGLSIAAHLGKLNVPYRIFGAPMESWKNNMPQGMLLKSEGFASNLYDPDNAFTLAHYCREVGQPYADIGLPVPVETFTAYGIEFQKRLVPNLETTKISSIRAENGGFQLSTADGTDVIARRVIVAAGITYFSYLPPVLENLPPRYVSHSMQHSDLSGLAGRKVAVVGAGASAVDIAALLHEAGAEVELVARANTISFHDRSMEPRSLRQQLLKPRTTIGIGWRSRLCTDLPLLFHAMPATFRFKVVKRHLGPAPGWFVKEKMVGRVPMHLGASLDRAEIAGDRVRLTLGGKQDGRQLMVDHVIGGTGYRVALNKLTFLDGDLRRQIRAVDDAPVLSRSFESSVPGLFFVGVASASCFGPLTRFACGAQYTAQRLSKHIESTLQRA